MKKNRYNILIFSALFSFLLFTTTCKKDELVPLSKFQITAFLSQTTGASAKLNCEYSYIGKLQNATLYYSTDSSVNNPTTSSCTLINNNLQNSLGGLTPLTTYYCYYIVDNGIDKHKTSIYKLKTSNYTQASITTNAAVNVLGNHATLSGSITSVGELPVTERGFCYSSTNATPTISNEHVTSGSGTGNFQKTIYNLNVSTTYYVRAYAKNSNGDIVYGNRVNFTTTNGKPIVSTSSASYSSTTTVTCGGNVTSNGGYAVTARGVCWSTSGTPTIDNSHTEDGSGSGSFTSTITGLNSNQTYYIRAYAQNAKGTSYGAVVTLGSYCPASVTDYDGNAYTTVQIGTQCWMKQNLKTTHYQSGTYILFYSQTADWSYLTTPARCYPNGESSNYGSYGYLYNWYAVNGGNLCPSGWHVPTDQDFTTLENYLGTNAGGAMKATGYTYWSSPNTGATNSSGFLGYGAGYRTEYGTYYNWHEYGIFWTTGSYDTYYAIDRCLLHDGAYLSRFGTSSYNYSLHKSSGASVRCLKD